MRWFAGVGTALSLIILLFDFMEFIRKTSGKTFIGFSLILQMLFFKLPTLLQQLLPFIVLFSAILTFWYLNRYQELAVMRASGISVRQMLQPVIIGALLVGVVDLTIINPISSGMMLRYEHLHDRFFKGNTGSLAVSESGLWLREVDETMQTVFHVRHVNTDLEKLTHVSVFQSNLRDRFLRRLDAAEAIFEGRKVILNNVWITAPEQTPEFVEHYELATSLTFNNLQNRGADPQSLSFWKIPQYVELLEKSGLSGLKYKLHWQTLIARVLWLGVMVILAASCALRPIRQGKTFLLIAIGISSAFALYFLRDITYALGVSGKIPLAMAAWSPVLISCFLSIAALLHFEES